MHMYRNIGASSRNYFCSGKAINIRYSESINLAVVIHHENAHAPYYIAISTLPGSTTFYSLIS
jgi:hypothetical protein